MKADEIERYIDKKVLLILKSGFKYNCKIVSVTSEDTRIIDMFGADVTIQNNTIELIQEKKKEQNNE